eukprot:CAMPEP_0117447924 /NCGR_PEP_ID=MMETSP0759-20121206/7127_1 /TAXON_ID=63605 /ORGANISM="Percolomonas cosmopolitus, Strain WS" /LENGTH=757 /DNA_ID=CAMNT_0005240277 /DNA_START=601 /DNA_END=2871 /DNA_ORIENTATION=-
MGYTPLRGAESNLYGCASTLLLDVLVQKLQFLKFFSMFFRVLLYLPLLIINSYPMEKTRRKSRYSWCTKILFIALVLIIILLMCAEGITIVNTSFCLAQYTGKYNDIDEQSVPMQSFNFIFLFLRQFFVKPTPSNDDALKDMPAMHSINETATTNVSSWLLASLKSLSPVLHSIATARNISSAEGISLLPAAQNSLLSVEHEFAPNVVFTLVGEPRTSHNPRIPWLKTWIALRLAVSGFIFLMIPIILGVVMLHCCCRINVSYEWFRQQIHKRYTQSLFETTSTPPSCTTQPDYQKFIDQDEPQSDIEMHEAIPDDKVFEDDLSVPSEWVASSRETIVESTGLKGFFRSLLSDAKEFVKGDKLSSRTHSIMSRKAGLLDVLPPQRMLMGFVGGIFLMVVILILVHGTAQYLYVLVYDALIIVSYHACDPNMIFNDALVCKILTDFFQVFYVIMDVTLTFSLVVVPLILFSMMITLFLKFRKQIIMHRRGLQRICSVRRIDGNIATSTEYASAQAFHIGLGALIIYLTLLFLIGGVWGVVIVLVLLSFVRSDSLYMEALVKFGQSVFTQLSVAIISVVIFKASKVVYKKTNVHRNTLFKNPHVQWIYDLCASLAVLLVEPMRAFLSSFVLRFVQALLFFPRIDFSASYSHKRYVGLFLAETFYGHPVVNTFVDLLYQNCLSMEKEEENCFDHETRRRLRQKCRRDRVSKFLIGALLLKNSELRGSRIKEHISLRSKKDIIKARLKKMTLKRKSTYKPP